MSRPNERLKKNSYLNEHVFYGLTNLNDGFDAPGVKYFSASDFEVVLSRIQQLGLGLYGIEPWKDGEFYDVVTYEDVTNDPTDPKWYIEAFKKFKEDGEELQYAATYHIPEDLLLKEN